MDDEERRDDADHMRKKRESRRDGHISWLTRGLPQEKRQYKAEYSSFLIYTAGQME